jgi:hypothetical protein
LGEERYRTKRRGEDIKLIIILIVAIIATILVLRLVWNREHYLLLSEVIPQARIVSQEEGIIEYQGVHYILGTHDLKRKQSLIQSLDLLGLKDSFIVDMRFNRQIIIRIDKNLQSRRR